MATDDDPVTVAEVSGVVVRAVVVGVEKFSPSPRESARSILADHRLADPRDDEWYSLATFLPALEAIAEDVDECGTSALGERVPRAISDSTEAAAVLEALERLDERYRSSHRGDVGGYTFRQIGDDDGRVECDTPYPCAFDRGVVEAAAARAASGYVYLCEIGVCRADGASRCTYEVQW